MGMKRSLMIKGRARLHTRWAGSSFWQRKYFSDPEFGDCHPKVPGSKSMDVNFALRKKEAPMWWLFSFQDKTWKSLSVLGIQLAESSVLRVSLGCRSPWKVVVICCVNNKLFFNVWEKKYSNYQRSWLKTGVAGWGWKWFPSDCIGSSGTPTRWHEKQNNWAGNNCSYLPTSLGKSEALGESMTFLTLLLNGGWVGWLDSLDSHARLFFLSPNWLFSILWMVWKG